MDKLARTEKLTAQVSLALAAGMFSIMPVTYGAPVLDKVVAGGAEVKANGTTTAITSKEQNNIINWQDFSVNQGEKIQFDGGQKQHNYLNLVTGEQTSRINGTIEGGKDVYIVNPHGVVFGKEAKVDVGSLYVSTTKEALNTDKYLSTGASPLVNTASAAAGDVVNMGQINASKVYVEGGTIKFLDVDKISATGDNVELYANDAIKLGHAATSSVSVAANEVSDAAVTDKAAYKTNTKPTDYTNITKDNLFTATTGNLAGNYWLTEDIDLSNNAPITPIGSQGTAFSGVFDGNFYTVSNFAVSSGTYGGLFGDVTGTIKHLGVIKPSISGTTFAGGLAGRLSGGTISQSYVNGGSVASSVTGQPRTAGGAGGIVGVLKGGTISESYATGVSGSAAGGIAGYFAKGNITNVYTTNMGTDNGIFVVSGGDSANASYAYTTSSATNYGKNGSSTVLALKDTDTYHYNDTYSAWSISNKGGENTTWRIYEGKTLPLLRCFLKANGTVKVNYSYTQGTQSGSNNGADLETTYNHEQVSFGTPSYSETSAGVTVDSSVITAPTDSVDYKNVTWNSVTNAVGLKAAYYTGQDGYDLVGNNITIKPRSVTISADGLAGKSLEKTYNGTADVDKTKLKSLFTGNTTTAGFIEGDDTYELNTDNISGTYTRDGVASADVGNGSVDGKLKVTLKGGVTFNNKDGYHNYELSGSNSADFTDKTLNGIINKATLTVTVANNNTISREYNGKNNSAVKDADKLTSSNVGSFLTLKGAATTTGSDNKSTTDDVQLAVNGESGTYVDRAEQTDGSYVDTATGKVGSHKVKYTGITLTGTKATNYKLVDADGNDIYQVATNGVGEDINTSGGTFYASGKITPKNITVDSFSMPNATATKEYDGTSYLKKVSVDGTDTDVVGMTLNSSDIISGDDVNFKVTADSSGYGAYFTNTGTSDKVSNAGKDYDITYHVTISGEDTGNYTFNTKEITNGSTDDVTGSAGSGSITPRLLTFVLGSKTSGINKTYDKSASVYADTTNKRTAITLADGLVAYNSTDAAHQLLSGDNVTLSITGEYEGADVKGTASNPEAQAITYTVAISGDKAKNYTLKYDKDNPQNVVNSTTVTGAKGTINPVRLTNVALASGANIHKTFDTATTAGAVDTDKLTIDKVTFDGLVSGDSKSDIITDAVLDTLNKNGNYYKFNKEKNAYVPDAHVARDGNNKVTTQKVKYTGLSSASNNYLFDTDTVEGEGTIDALAIKDVTLAKKQAITKVYDGNASVERDAYDPQSQTAQAATEFVGDLSTEVNGHTITLDYTLRDANYTDDSGAKQKNVGKATQARFVLQVSTDGDNGDYSLAGGGDANYTLDQDGNVVKDLVLDKGKGDGITARHIYARAALEPVKDYDGTKVVKKDGKAVSGADVVTLTGMLDADKGDNASTALYTSKDVVRNQDGSVGTQTVKYTVTLHGDSATNYEVYKDSDHSQAVTLDQAGALTSDGIINPLDTKVHFSTISKTYNQSAAIDSATHADEDSTKQTLATVNNLQSHADGTTTAQDEVNVNIDTNKSSFDSPNKGVKTRKVTYQFTLSGAEANDYNLTNDGLTYTTDASGNRTYTLTVEGNTISPYTLSDSDIVIGFNDINKVYDATTTLDNPESYINTKDKTKDIGFKIAGYTVGTGDYSIKSAAYQSVNVTNTKADYTFTLSDTMVENFDFSKVSSTLYQGKAVTKDGDNEVYWHPTATITPKDLTATLTKTPADSTIFKDYDGTKAVYLNNDKNSPLSGSTLNSKIKFEGFVDGDTVALDTAKTTALYTDANASDTAGSKTVEYTLALKDTTGGTHAGNYRINYDAGTKQANNVLKGKGTINRRQLTLKVADDALTKTYDSTPTLSTDSKKKIGLDGLQNGDTLVLNVDKINAVYGKNDSTAEKFEQNGDSEQNGDVNWDSKAGKALSKTIYISGLKNAAANGTGTADFATNYKIDDTRFYRREDGKGHINQLDLTEDNIETGWEGTITKQYDNTDKVLDPKSHFYIRVKAGVVGTGSDVVPIEYDLGNAVYANGQKDVTTAPVNVVYTVTGLTKTKLNNFNMTTALANSFAHDYQTTGTITPRHLLVSTQMADEISKVYDGTTTIAQTDPQTYNQTKSNVLIKKLLTGTANDDGASVTITPTYADENVSYSGGYSDANVTTKDVNFGLAIKNGTAGNYVFYDATDTNKLPQNADTKLQTITAPNAGKITTATLTLKDVSLANRVYNGESNGESDIDITDIDTAGITFTLDGFKKDADKTLDNFAGDANIKKNNIKGKYGAAATEDAYDVNRDTTDGTAGTDTQGKDYGYKAVYYSDLNDALQKLRESGSTDAIKTIAGNYTIGNTQYFAAAKRRGVIRPLAITAAAVRENLMGTTKVYNGNAYVDKANLKKNLAYGVVLDTQAGEAKDKDFNYDDTDQRYQWVNIDYQLADGDGAAVYDAGKNVGKDLAITYTISGITPEKLHNFAMDSGAQNAVIGTHHANKGAITPKTVTVHLAQTKDINKVYDGNAQAKTQNMLVIDDGILAGDVGKVNVALTDGYYTDGSGTADKNAGTNKNIKYTVTLSKSDAGTDTDKENYTLVAQDDTAYPSTGNTQTETKELDATGTISKRPVYVHFTDDRSPTGLDKAYNGSGNTTYTTDAAKLAAAQGKVTVVKAGTESGFVTGDDVQLDSGAITVNYADGNVARDAAGKVTTKDVYFANFQGTGADKDNYDFKTKEADSTKLTAKNGGTITPLTLGVSLKDANPTKEYDGTSNVSAAYAAAPASTTSNVAVDRTNLVTGDSINVSFAKDANGHTLTPQYADKHAGQNIGVDYFLQWDNQNYELVRTPTGTQSTNDVTVAADGNGLTTTLHTTAGSITPRVLSVANVAQAEKTYDGNATVNNAAANITFGNVVSGDTLGLTAAGLYDSAQAAHNEQEDEQGHQVTYNLAINNADYKLADATVTGTGVIHRRGLVIKADPASVRAGEAMPSFTGSVSNWATGEDGSSSFAFQTEPEVTTQIPGEYAVYGWYNGATQGNYGQNYTFAQDPANATAFTVELIDPGKEYHENVNPRQQFIPDHTTYSQSSHDGVGGFVKPPEAQVAYMVNQQLVQYAGSQSDNSSAAQLGQNTSLQGVYTLQDTGTVLGSMSIQAADVVNLEGDNRLDLTDATTTAEQAPSGEIAIVSEDNASIAIESEDNARIAIEQEG